MSLFKKVCISRFLGLLLFIVDCHIQTTAKCWNVELVPLTQEQNVLLAVKTGDKKAVKQSVFDVPGFTCY